MQNWKENIIWDHSNKHLSRDEFENYIHGLKFSERLSMLPTTIWDWQLNIWSYSDNFFIQDWKMYRRDYNDRSTDIRWVKKQIPFDEAYSTPWFNVLYSDDYQNYEWDTMSNKTTPKNWYRIDEMQELLLFLYDNWHLPEYSTPKQVG